MRIGFDLDEILADCLTAIIEFHNTVYQTSLRREQFKSYQFWDTWGGTPEEAVTKVYEFYRTEYARRMNPIPGAQEGVRILKPKNELFVITSRANDFADVTIQWTEENFPEVSRQMHFANHYAKNGTTKSKAQI